METQTVTERVHALLPIIRQRRSEIEQTRHLPRDLADALIKTGIFSLCVPQAIGGLEASPLDTMRVIETAATADGSTGWCAMIGTINNSVAGYMNERGAREVFADPMIPSAGIAAPAGTAIRVEGGVRISGRWPFASGITHCEWVWAGCLVMENGQPRMTAHGPEIMHACLPVADVAIHDTWHVSGLCGTGSNDFSASDVFVPEQRLFALVDPSGHRSEPLYQLPPFGLFVSFVVCVGLGIARCALDELVELAQKKTPSLYREVLADKAVTQVELARAETALGAARAWLYETVQDRWQSVCAGRPCSPRQIALGRAAATHAAEISAAVTRTVATLGGGGSLYLASSLQRHARDAEAIGHHFTVAPHTWEEAGRVLFGRVPNVPVF